MKSENNIMEQANIMEPAKMGKQLCGDFGGKNRSGEPCGKVAGWGVPDTKTGKCRRCRRLGSGRKISTLKGLAKKAARDNVEVSLATINVLTLLNAVSAHCDTKSATQLRKAVESLERMRATKSLTEKDLQTLSNILRAIVDELGSAFDSCQTRAEFETEIARRLKPQLTKFRI